MRAMLEVRDHEIFFPAVGEVPGMPSELISVKAHQVSKPLLSPDGAVIPISIFAAPDPTNDEKRTARSAVSVVHEWEDERDDREDTRVAWDATVYMRLKRDQFVRGESCQLAVAAADYAARHCTYPTSEFQLVATGSIVKGLRVGSPPVVKRVGRLLDKIALVRQHCQPGRELGQAAKLFFVYPRENLTNPENDAPPEAIRASLAELARDPRFIPMAIGDVGELFALFPNDQHRAAAAPLRDATSAAARPAGGKKRRLRIWLGILAVLILCGLYIGSPYAPALAEFLVVPEGVRALLTTARIRPDDPDRGCPALSAASDGIGNGWPWARVAQLRNACSALKRCDDEAGSPWDSDRLALGRGGGRLELKEMSQDPRSTQAAADSCRVAAVAFPTLERVPYQWSRAMTALDGDPDQIRQLRDRAAEMGSMPASVERLTALAQQDPPGAAEQLGRLAHRPGAIAFVLARWAEFLTCGIGGDPTLSAQGKVSRDNLRDALAAAQEAVANPGAIWPTVRDSLPDLVKLINRAIPDPPVPAEVTRPVWCENEFPWLSPNHAK